MPKRKTRCRSTATSPHTQALIVCDLPEHPDTTPHAASDCAHFWLGRGRPHCGQTCTHEHEAS